MTRYSGQTKVTGGYYWNPKSWHFEAVEGDSGTLSGTPEDRFIRMPGVLIIPGVLVLSFLFVVFLPFIGIALLAWAIALKLGDVGQGVLKSAVGTLAPAWRPGEAWLAGKAEKKDATPPAPTTPALDELEVDIAERRADEEPPTSTDEPVK